jgi:hypothetical protein
MERIHAFGPRPSIRQQLKQRKQILIHALKRPAHPQWLRLIQFFQMKAMPKGKTIRHTRHF